MVKDVSIVLQLPTLFLFLFSNAQNSLFSFYRIIFQAIKVKLEKVKYGEVSETDIGPVEKILLASSWSETLEG